MIPIRDRSKIEAFLLRDKPLHIYEIGDLDPFFWDYTAWYALPGSDAELAALVLVYSGKALPTVLAFDRENLQHLGVLLRDLCDVLPDRFHAHFSPGLNDVLADKWRFEPKGRYLMMNLMDTEPVRGVDTGGVEFFAPSDQSDLETFYEQSYPGHWFDARMLETGQYVGIRDRGSIVCAAGIHVFSPAYGVAALGNIATDLRCRRQGLGRRATARLCQSLLDQLDTIGLNVKADNLAAIGCYEGLGFAVEAEYDEFMVERTD